MNLTSYLCYHPAILVRAAGLEPACTNYSDNALFIRQERYARTLVGLVGVEPTLFLLWWIYSPLPRNRQEHQTHGIHAWTLTRDLLLRRQPLYTLSYVNMVPII